MLLNNEIWHKIEDFQFENSPQEYGFVTRLAYENSWTEDFTRKAILEYKKFMYLVSVNDTMLSPSEIVDIVWHQHLIYSDSYHKFCEILEKQIKHLPSTHNSEETHLFNEAFKNTETKYKEIFGTSGWYLWTIKKDTDLLRLNPKKIEENKLKTYLIIGVILLILIFTFVARPVFVSISNPYFLQGLVVLFILGIIIFKRFVLHYFQKLFSREEYNLINEMNSFELIALKEKKTQPIINTLLWQLIKEKQLSVENNQITIIHKRISENVLEKAVRNSMQKTNPISYGKLCKSLSSKNAFKQYFKSTENILTFIKNTKEYQKIQIYSYCFFALFFSILFSRAFIGELRNKPITFVGICIFILMAYFFYFIKLKLNALLRKSILTTATQLTPQTVKSNDIGWSFLLSGAAIFGPELISAATYYERNQQNSGSGSGSSGSSCSSDSSSSSSGDSSSSCGSSCGGCGGGGD